MYNSCTILVSGLAGELYQVSSLSKEELDTIDSEVMSFRPNEELLSIFIRKTKDQFDKFMDALDMTGQQYVRNYITGRRGKLSTTLCFKKSSHL